MPINRNSLQNFALYFYSFSMPIESFNLYGYGSISFFAAVIYLLTILPSIKIVGVLNKNIYFFWPIVVFLILLILNSLINMNSYSSRLLDVPLFLNIILFFLITNHAKKDNLILEKALYALVIGTIFASLLLFLGIGIEISDEGLRPGRITFLKSGPNEVGIKIATGALVIIAFVTRNSLSFSKIHRYLLCSFLPIIFVSILQTGSRTALTVPVIGGLIWVFFKMLDSKYKLLALVSGIISLIIIFIPLIYFASQSAVVVDRVSVTGGTGDMGEFGRFWIWAQFISRLDENLIFGNGLSGYDLISYNIFAEVESPHNVLLEVMLYTGLVGLFFYLLFLYRIVYTSYLLYKDGNIIPTILLPAVFAFVLALQGLSEKTSWLAIAYIVGTYIYNKKNTRELR